MSAGPGQATGRLDDRCGELVTTVRAALDALQVVEHRLATVAALVERHGTRYVQRATIELNTAIEALTVAERRRITQITTLCTELGVVSGTSFAALIDIIGAPFSDPLAEARAQMLSTKARVTDLSERAEEVLGRRLALVAEALAAGGEIETTTYGRATRARPRYVDGLL
jgi:hypothetical protein